MTKVRPRPPLEAFEVELIQSVLAVVYGVLLVGYVWAMTEPCCVQR